MRVYKSRLFVVIGLVLLAEGSFSQLRTLGSWKMFLPYGNSFGACDGGDRVYEAGSKSIFSYEKSSGIIQTYDKASGLSDLGITKISYDPNTKFLAIVYNNSNLDFIYNGTDVYNVPDFKNLATTGAVNVYSVSFLNGNAYVSSDLGISVVDLTRMQVSNTYLIGANGSQLKVYATTFDSVNIYAATPVGVRYASRNAANLQDFNSWSTFSLAQNIPAKKTTYIQAFNNKIYAVIPSGNGSDTLYQYNIVGNSWSPAFSAVADSITGLNQTNGSLYFSAWDSPSGSTGYLGKIDAAGNLTYNQTLGHSRPAGWFESNGVSWEPDYYIGLVQRIGNTVQRIIPEGPQSANVFALDCKNGVLNVAPGGVDQSWSAVGNLDGFFVYKNGTWQNHNQYTDGALNGINDFICTASIRSTGTTYYGSFFWGLAELNQSTGNITMIDKNSPVGLLQGEVGDSSRTKITCLYADSSDNLWIGNAAPSLIKVIRPDGTWRKFTTAFSPLLLKKMIVDQYGQVWASTFQPGGVMVLNYGADMDNTADDKYAFLQSGANAGNLPSNNVFSLAVDHTGNVWVGTDAGIGIFYCPGNVFQGGCDATQIKVTLNGYVGYLFGRQTVRALAVDAANRMWVGTTDGLWLISNDGQTTYQNFTTDNSPLPDNEITDITINDATGEVFIGTDGGLVSYQGDAIGPSCADCNGALVYPNPVKPDYSGPIAIKGLTDNAYVKITDIDGHLIFQGRANGTQMIWNGNGYDGARAKSGVYLVFSSTDLGKQKQVAKILITN